MTYDNSSNICEDKWQRFLSFFLARFNWYMYQQPADQRKCACRFISSFSLSFSPPLHFCRSYPSPPQIHLITFLWLSPSVAAAAGAASPFRKCLHCSSHRTLRFSPWQSTSKKVEHCTWSKHTKMYRTATTLWWVQLGGETWAVSAAAGSRLETTLSSFVPLLLVPSSRAAIN